ncbi:LemA family protein [Reichenbachiella carrageenanivorans]|uniref:LemA family protein n=1 Tax=Reichenbachiella carrageenanivorans TaxID=2979869 RepID=A0ABY6CYU3_9BACT|nr:LemA family protein [Reichenbachiella carrageenanivorans]UXX79096.1 LemA family protein [Reichenbachiella carrageenanivorans]
MNKKTLIILGVLALVVIWMYSSVTGKYNAMVSMDEGVTAQWANVETQYQRRADLIPNLVNTVKGYAAHEKETLEGVIAARAKATSTTIDPSNLNAQSMQQFQEAQSGLSSALSRLLVTVEKYPDLKANQNFLELQAQLEGTENRIAVERRRFNEIVQSYNTLIRRFPNTIFAGMFGFEKRTPFAAQAGSENAPTVEF